MRIDVESTLTIANDIVQDVLRKVEEEMKKELDILVLQDYNKGFLTTDLIQGVLHLANKNDIPVAVDPKKTDF